MIDKKIEVDKKNYPRSFHRALIQLSWIEKNHRHCDFQYLLHLNKKQWREHDPSSSFGSRLVGTGSLGCSVQAAVARTRHDPSSSLK